MSAVDAKAIVINVGVVDGASGPFNRIGASAMTMGAQTNAGMMKAQSGVSKFGATASKAATAGAAAIGVGLLLSAKAAIAFESSFAGVKKTVDTSAVGFERLADGVRQMATEIPIGVNELNRIMELGGQLGVGPGQLLEFTDTIAKIGVTTTLATEEASMGFARLDNIMQLGGQSFDNMGSSIVDLGNNFAATENEILTFALRIAPVGATVGLTIDEVLGLATAFSSVGIPAERGGTALQKTFIKISEAAKTGGVELDIFADTAGMTSEAFAELAETDPAASFTAFVTGLGEVEDSGGNVFAILDQVGLGNERVRATLLAAANAGDVLTDALDLSSEAYGVNNALNEEAAKRFETTASQATLAKNKINDLAISIGTNLLPALGDFAGGTIMIIDWLQNLGDAAKSTIGLLAGVVAGAGIITAGHPVIGGLLLFAAVITKIGANAREAEQRIIDMKEAGRSTGDGYTSGTGRDLIIDAIGPGGLNELEALGFTIENIDVALRGTNAEWQEFRNNVKERSGGSLLDMPEAIGRLRIFRSEVQATGRTLADEDERARRALVTQLLTQAENERRWAAQAPDGGGSRTFYGTGQMDSFIAPEITYPAYDAAAEYSGEIITALDDYVTVFTESFNETDERIRSQIGLWYEFGDALDYSTDSIKALSENLTRQVEAIGAFETLIAGMNLTPVMEEFVRNSFNTPTLMEGFVEWSQTDPAGFAATMTDWENRLDPLMRTIVEIFNRDFPELEFKAGFGLLSTMSGIVDEIVQDPNNNYNAAEAWLGVIYQTLDKVDASDFDAVYNMLLEAFGTGGVNGDLGISLTLIQGIAEALGWLPTQTDITVTTHFNHTGDPQYGALIESGTIVGNSDLSDFEKAGGKAFGGNVFADKPYIVGELGPELFVPFNSGTIIPNSKFGGGTQNSIQLTFNVEKGTAIADIQSGLVLSGVADMVDLGRAGL